MKQILPILTALIIAITLLTVPVKAETSCPYRVFYEENGQTLREYHAENDVNYYPFSVLYLGGITVEQYNEYMTAAKRGDPFSIDITFSGENGKVYFYNTCTMKNGKLTDSFGAYTDSSYTLQISASLELFRKDGEMLYAFSIYSEDIDEDVAESVRKAKKLIAAADTCTVDVYSGDSLTDRFGHTGEYTGVPVTSKLTADVSGLVISEPADAQYKGRPIKPSVTVKDVMCTLKKGTDYTVSYSGNNAVGTAEITVTGKGMYSGSKTITFDILPRKSALKASVSGNRIKLKWGNAGDADKYLIYCSTDGGENFSRIGAVSGGKSSAKLSLPADGNYVFRIRSYKTVNGKRYYSPYSACASL